MEGAHPLMLTPLLNPGESKAAVICPLGKKGNRGNGTGRSPTRTQNPESRRPHTNRAGHYSNAVNADARFCSRKDTFYGVSPLAHPRYPVGESLQHERVRVVQVDQAVRFPALLHAPPPHLQVATLLLSLSLLTLPFPFPFPFAFRSFSLLACAVCFPPPHRHSVCFFNFLPSRPRSVLSTDLPLLDTRLPLLLFLPSSHTLSVVALSSDILSSTLTFPHET